MEGLLVVSDYPVDTHDILVYEGSVQTELLLAVEIGSRPEGFPHFFFFFRLLVALWLLIVGLDEGSLATPRFGPLNKANDLLNFLRSLKSFHPLSLVAEESLLVEAFSLVNEVDVL